MTENGAKKHCTPLTYPRNFENWNTSNSKAVHGKKIEALTSDFLLVIELGFYLLELWACHFISWMTLSMSSSIISSEI